MYSKCTFSTSKHTSVSQGNVCFLCYCLCIVFIWFNVNSVLCNIFPLLVKPSLFLYDTNKSYPMFLLSKYPFTLWNMSVSLFTECWECCTLTDSWKPQIKTRSFLYMKYITYVLKWWRLWMIAVWFLQKNLQAFFPQRSGCYIYISPLLERGDYGRTWHLSGLRCLELAWGSSVDV